MSKILKALTKGNKIRVGDVIEIPKFGELLVENVYKIGDNKDYTVACKHVITGKVGMFGEDQIIKYKKSHLKLVK